MAERFWVGDSTFAYIPSACGWLCVSHSEHRLTCPSGPDQEQAVENSKCVEGWALKYVMSDDNSRKVTDTFQKQLM